MKFQAIEKDAQAYINKAKSEKQVYCSSFIFGKSIQLKFDLNGNWFVFIQREQLLKTRDLKEACDFYNKNNRQ